MHRTKLKNLLKSYRILFEEDKKNLSPFLAFVEKNQDCFDRNLSEGHITGSSWILNREKTHTLLTHHHKLNKWLQLGGHADNDSDIFSVAAREATEESGLLSLRPLSFEIFDIDIHLVPDSQGGHYHYDVRFLFEADRSEKLIISSESKDLAWVELENLEKFTQERSVLRMGQKAKILLNTDCKQLA